MVRVPLVCHIPETFSTSHSDRLAHSVIGECCTGNHVPLSRLDKRAPIGVVDIGNNHTSQSLNSQTLGKIFGYAICAVMV